MLQITELKRSCAAEPSPQSTLALQVSFTPASVQLKAKAHAAALGAGLVDAGILASCGSATGDASRWRLSVRRCRCSSSVTVEVRPVERRSRRRRRRCGCRRRPVVGRPIGDADGRVGVPSPQSIVALRVSTKAALVPGYRSRGLQPVPRFPSCDTGVGGGVALPSVTMKVSASTPLRRRSP